MMKVSEEQIEFIKENYKNLSREELANYLNLSIHQTKRLLKKLNFKKKKQNSIHFSDKELLEAVKYSQSHSEAARKLGYIRQSGLKTKYGLAIERLNPDISHFKLTSRSRISRNGNTIESFYNIYRARAIKRKLKFLLNLKEFSNIVTQICDYCGKCGTTFYNKYCGIDRVDNNIGYILTNCVPCCNICNLMKNNLTKKEFLSHIESIYKNNK